MTEQQVRRQIPGCKCFLTFNMGGGFDHGRGHGVGARVIR